MQSFSLTDAFDGAVSIDGLDDTTNLTHNATLLTKNVTLPLTPRALKDTPTVWALVSPTLNRGKNGNFSPTLPEICHVCPTTRKMLRRICGCPVSARGLCEPIGVLHTAMGKRFHDTLCFSTDPRAVPSGRMFFGFHTSGSNTVGNKPEISTRPAEGDAIPTVLSVTVRFWSGKAYCEERTYHHPGLYNLGSDEQARRWMSYVLGEAACQSRLLRLTFLEYERCGRKGVLDKQVYTYQEELSSFELVEKPLDGLTGAWQTMVSSSKNENKTTRTRTYSTKTFGHARGYAAAGAISPAFCQATCTVFSTAGYTADATKTPRSGNRRYLCCGVDEIGPQDARRSKSLAWAMIGKIDAVTLRCREAFKYVRTPLEKEAVHS
ncbi:hypothetical protein BDV93DRAFT_546067 [Ceratobasidium sp. AG-I]|nr:hypothetical protein BDV93DRAFT_546067 [Ceratobasidium sp. AG-I]